MSAVRELAIEKRDRHELLRLDPRTVLALLDERDAAIRRAEEAETARMPATSRRVLQQPEPAYLASIIEQFEIIVGSLTDEHLKEHAQIGLDAALRSQESQKPPEPTDNEAAESR